MVMSHCYSWDCTAGSAEPDAGPRNISSVKVRITSKPAIWPIAAPTSRLFEKGSRTDRALKVAIAEMYLQGVSTRQVTTIMESSAAWR